MNTMTVTAQVTRSTRPSTALHISLWVVQALLGLVFLTHSAMLVTQPIAALAEMMVWPVRFPQRWCASSASARCSARWA